jgi:hypothetical protein
MMLVAIVDDDADLAGRMATDVEDAGFDASIVTLSSGQTIDVTIGQMMTAGVEAVICDHRLQHRVHVPFDGARLVASLYERKIPAVLVTRFFDQDFDVSIRRERHRIPVLLHRDTADPDEINRAVNTAAQEIANGVPPWRVPYRTVVRVEDVRTEDVRVVDAIIPGWNPDNIVRFPLDVLPENMRPRVAIGFRFFAKVNVGASRTEDIFLVDPEFGSEGDDGDD